MLRKIIYIALLCFMLVCVLASCDIVDKHTHSFGEWVTTKNVTCTENGNTERYCECGEKQTQTFYATGHKYGEWVVTKEPTCAEIGNKERYCECGEKQTQSISATGHKYGEWIVAKEAACIVDGLKEKVCVACQCKETETISAKGEHNYVDGICSGCNKEVERIVLTNKNSTIILRDIPLYVGCSAIGVDITSLEWTEESSYVYISISGEVTYTYFSGSTDVNFRLKIYDYEGYVVYERGCMLSNYLAKGDKFKDETFSIDVSSLEENKEYTLKIEVWT